MDYYIGLMSGTSMDGIDAAVVDVENHRLIHGFTQAYSEDLQQNLIKVLEREGGSFKEIALLNKQIGEEFAEAVKRLLKETRISPRSIRAIGSHGQTVAHDALCLTPYTVQLGCAHTIAQKTGIPVIADFRTRDVVAGGQGAPFAPLYHRELFYSELQNNALVNIGGIANLTLIPSQGVIRGWDVGPGNCLMDYWVNHNLGQPYDAEGVWAMSGKVLPALLDTMLSDPFFNRPSPKSIGKEYFSEHWLNKGLTPDLNPADVQATLLHLTAHAIADALKMQKDHYASLILCGGGAHNLYLTKILQSLLPDTQVVTTEEFKVSPDFLEAMLFAWLASKTIKGERMDLSSITGSKQPLLLGVVYPV